MNPNQHIKPAEFVRRRKRLMQMMGKASVAILPAAPTRIRNRDAEHPYRQDSDFYYLTGFNEPEAVLVLIPKRKHGEVILFCRERDPEMETWHGRRAGLEGAMEFYGADDAFPITDIDDILPGLLESCERVFYAMGCDTQFDQQVTGWVNQLKEQARAGVHTPGEFVALDHLLHDMRLYKSRAEVSAMRRAAKISAQAHIRAMQQCRPRAGQEASRNIRLPWRDWRRFRRVRPGDAGCPRLPGPHREAIRVWQWQRVGRPARASPEHPLGPTNGWATDARPGRAPAHKHPNRPESAPIDPSRCAPTPRRG